MIVGAITGIIVYLLYAGIDKMITKRRESLRASQSDTEG